MQRIPPVNPNTAPPRGGNTYAGGGKGEPRAANPAKSEGPAKFLPIEIPAIPLNELNSLTGKFGSKALIGEGSCGRVFRAKLSNAVDAAIKKLDTSTSQESDSEFAAQVRTQTKRKCSQNL